MTLAGIATMSMLWADAVARASWQGGIALSIAWAAARFIPRLSPAARCFILRVGYLRILLALFCAGALELPLLPPSQAIGPVPGLPRGESMRALDDPSPVGPGKEATPPAGSWASSRVMFGLMLAWTVGASCGVLTLIRAGRAARALSRSARPLGLPSAESRCARIGQRMGLSRTPLLATAAAATGPMLVGIRRPVIILPSRAANTWNDGDLGLMIAHELAHVRRHDVLWRWLDAIVQVLFFFHPAVWLARRESNLAEEMACDRLAIEATGASPFRYGDLLLRIATRLDVGRHVELLAAHAVQTLGVIRRRITALSRPEPPRRYGGALMAAIRTAAIVVGVIPWALVARAPLETPAGASAALERTLAHGHAVRSVAFSPDGRTLVSAGAGGMSRMWDVRSGALLRSLSGSATLASTATYSPDGTLAVTYREDAVLLVEPSKAHSTRLLATRPGLDSVAFSAQGRSLAVATCGAVDLVDARSGDRRLAVAGDRRPAIAVSSDGRLLACKTSDGQVALCDAATGQRLRSMSASSGARIRALAFSPDGTVLAAVETHRSGGDVTLWQTDTARRERVIDLAGERPLTLAFSPAGRLLAVGGTDRITMWDRRTGRLVETLPASSAQVCGVAFSPDGKRLACGGADRTVRVWRLPGG